MIIHILGTKTNFVDANNVLVGYDTQQDCCEHARWWISEAKDAPEPTSTDTTDRDVSAYFFDPESVKKREHESDDSREQYWITFRLVAENSPDLWLTLANGHNGYYAHGFTVEVGGKTIWQDAL